MLGRPQVREARLAHAESASTLLKEKSGLDFADVERSMARIQIEDLRRLAEIARVDLDAYISRSPDPRAAFRPLKLCVALCQGAALHFVDQRNGVKDLDIYTFFRAGETMTFPARRRGVHDFGLSKFGRHPDDEGFSGRRVDVMGRSIACSDDTSPSDAVRQYLKTTPTGTAWHLAQKAVVLIDPPAVCGTVIWPERDP